MYRLDTERAAVGMSFFNHSLFSVILILLFCSPAFSGWQKLDVDGSTDSFQNLHFPDVDTGYVVSFDRHIYKTSDGGDNWTLQYTAANSLDDVHFPVDTMTGYVVGHSGIILKTTDGGANWNLQNSGTVQILTGVCFLDNLTGYASGFGDTILKTTDGGLNWNPQDPGTMAVRGIHFPVDSSTGWVIGSSGRILKTTDGGTNWVTQNSGSSDTLMSVYFPVDNLTGYVGGGSGTLLKTTDGGANWNPLNPGEAVTNTGSIHFPVDTLTGYITTSGLQSMIRKTTDGGLTWISQPVPSPSCPGDVYFPTTTTGYAAGCFGAVLKTTDSGASQVVLHPTGSGSVSSFSSQGGCVAGSRWDCVNDQAGNAGVGAVVANDGSTSSVSDGNGATGREMFSLYPGTVPAGSTITGIEIFAKVGEGAGPVPDVSLSYQRMGTDGSPVDGITLQIPASSCCTHELVTLWQDLGWTDADIDTLEIGIVHTNGGLLEMSQIYVIVTYEPPGCTYPINYRSIGGPSFVPYATGLAAIDIATSTVNFSGGANLPTNIGLGDELILDPGMGNEEIFYILARDGVDRVTIQGTAGQGHSTPETYVINRAYTTIQTWEDDIGVNGRGGDLIQLFQRLGVGYRDIVNICQRLFLNKGGHFPA